MEKLLAITESLPKPLENRHIDLHYHRYLLCGTVSGTLSKSIRIGLKCFIISKSDLCDADDAGLEKLGHPRYR